MFFIAWGKTRSCLAVGLFALFLEGGQYNFAICSRSCAQTIGGSGESETDNAGLPLTPISQGDGTFEIVNLNGQTIWQGARQKDGSSSRYMYFRLPDLSNPIIGNAFVEVEYVDIGTGSMTLQYNASLGLGAYHSAEIDHENTLSGRGLLRTAVFQLNQPDFRQAQNNAADLRLVAPEGKVPLHVVSAHLFRQPTIRFKKLDAKDWMSPYVGQTRNDIDAKSLHHKVLCGYQGWFRCPGDPAEGGWVHWSRARDRIASDTLTFEMWPDMKDLTAEEKYPATGFAYPDGSPAELFSSVHQRTIGRHFEWMEKYGLDGALVQRFVPESTGADSVRVLGYAAKEAQRTGRVFAVEYDMSGVPTESLFDRITTDWKWLVDEMGITKNPRYLHHNGKPILGVWGFYSDRFDGDLANKLIDFFKADGPYQVTLVGGCPWSWRMEKNPEWARAFRRFDIISPWNVGNVKKVDGNLYAQDATWVEDIQEAGRHGMGFMPVVYPGFSWDNLQRKPAGSTNIPRLGGDFYWRQFEAASALEISFVKVAMFDEVDEGTAIFKVSNTPPPQAHFLTYEGLPPDWYLRTTGLGSKLIRGDRVNRVEVFRE